MSAASKLTTEEQFALQRLLDMQENRRGRLPISIAKIEALGEDEIFDRIENGLSQQKIADDIGISVSILNKWLHLEPARSARVKRALSESAEALLDQGLHALLNAKNPDDVPRAKALDNHYRHRAAIRNPRYRDSAVIAGDPNAPLSSAVSIDMRGATAEQLRAIASLVLPGSDENK